MDMADWNAVPLRRRLRSADRFNEAATVRGLRDAKTLGSKSRALLVKVTRCDQRELGPPDSRTMEHSSFLLCRIASRSTWSGACSRRNHDQKAQDPRIRYVSSSGRRGPVRPQSGRTYTYAETVHLWAHYRSRSQVAPCYAR